MTGEILRILLLVLQLAFLGLLYLVLLAFVRSLLRDLRGAERAQLASQAGIGAWPFSSRLTTSHRPGGPSRWGRSTPSAATSTAPSSSTTTS